MALTERTKLTKLRLFVIGTSKSVRLPLLNEMVSLYLAHFIVGY
jgi:hypothetical protein